MFAVKRLGAVEHPHSGKAVGAEWHIKLPLPVRPGDRLHTEIVILSKKPSSKPGRGYVSTLHTIRNQDSQIVFSCEVQWMVATRSRAD